MLTSWPNSSGCFLIGKAASKMAPMIPTSYSSCHCAVHPLWMCTGPSDSLLTEDIKTDGMARPRLGYERPWRPSYWHVLSDSSFLLILMQAAAMPWEVAWRGSRGKELRMTSKQQLAGKWSPQSSSIQQLMKNWILQMSVWVIWEVSPSQSSPEVTVALVNALIAAWERSWAKDPAKPHLHSWPKKLWNNKCVSH